jgi:uncharacterized repeat protein (TIGR03803 family)
MKLSVWKAACVLCVVLAAIVSSAQTFTTLVNFYSINGNSNGFEPTSSPIQGFDGNFYGVTELGGMYGAGTIYKITPGGTLTTLHVFTNGTDGGLPFGRLVQTIDGNFYGATTRSGTNGYGSIFKITPAGVLTNLASFNQVDGDSPFGALIQAADGNFYGTTEKGGANGYGTVFKMSPTGTLFTLYDFCSQSNCTDGSNPYGGVVQGADGSFYGMTSTGGTTNNGTVFKITTAGSLIMLYNFCSQASCTDGATPYGALIQAADGNFYGTTSAGGNKNFGTIFKINSTGTLKTLVNFHCSNASCSDGIFPTSLIQATDGNFYGTSELGEGGGAIFELIPGTGITGLHLFDRSAGYESLDAPVQGTDGTFYGTTAYGGPLSYNSGSVFNLSTGLGPFIETLPTVGTVRAKVVIMGNNLTGTGTVSFNGTAASFTVISDTEIQTTVPSGATTGPVQVVTPSSTLTSNTVFRVK